MNNKLLLLPLTCILIIMWAAFPEDISAQTTLSVRVNVSSDDAEQNLSSGAVSLTSSDLELAEDGSANQIVGLRFNTMTIPVGATITDAYVEFETDATWSSACDLTLRGQAADNPTTFTTVSNSINSRTKTTATVAWSPSAWNTVNEKHQTPALTSILQEIVNRPGWASGNSIAIFISGTGTREAEAYDGEALAAPLLVVSYTSCSNVSSAGSVGSNESNCTTFNPAAMTQMTAPSGGSGTLQYQWQSSPDGSSWTDISGATATSYDPAAILVTTYYRRGVRRSSCTTYLYSSSVTKTVGGCIEICSNSLDDDADGLIDCADPDCSNSLLVNAGTDAAICTGSSTTLTAAASGGSAPYTYAWSNGLGAGASKTVSPAITTTYTVTVTAANGCTATDQVLVTVNAPPTANAGADVSICTGASTTLTASGGTTYVWNNGLGAGASKTVSPAITTTYTVTVTAANGCTATDQVLVTVNAPPAANAGADASSCTGISTTLTASGGTGYAWDNGLGAGASKTVSPASTTTYTVTVTAANGCTATDQVTVSISTAPTANAGADATICNGVSVNLTATGGGTYAWSNGLGAGAAKTVNPASTTTYTVTVTAANGCTATDQVTVNVNSLPTADAGANASVCLGITTTLTASGGVSYNWSHGLGSGASKTILPLVTTTYTVTVTAANGCNATDQVTITVSPCTEICNNGLDDDSDGLTDCDDSDCGPDGDLGNGVSICEGSSTTLTVTATGGNGILTYAWSNGLGSGSTKTVSPVISTIYFVTVTAPSGCTDVASVAVTVSNCSENCTDGIDNDGDGLIDCDDPDCLGVSTPVLANDVYATCPGLPYSERVTYNDSNLQNPVFSISSGTTSGSVTIDATGKFFYTPASFDCTTDHFTYQVCNLASGCCSEAQVTLNLTDNTAPVMNNVPADLTLGCDEEIPVSGTVTAFENCFGVNMEYAEVSGSATSACNSYTITRTWTATDFCGNVATDEQVVTILDDTPPEIYRVYTLPNGAKLVAGVSNKMSNNWKYVAFPITFQQAPIVLTQVSSNADMSPVVVRQRNVGRQGFEMRLREEEAADGIHQGENVAWVAIEPGINASGFVFEAATLANVNDLLQSLNFSNSYTAAPQFFSSLQTWNESDPVSVRHQSLTATLTEFSLQEETSADPETAHTSETLGFWAMAAGSVMRDENGDIIGEKGTLNVSNAWATVTLSRLYTKPVVIIGGLSKVDGAPVTVRVRNVTANSFSIALQEWSYLDGNHSPELISWMVVEGSLPGNNNECGGSHNRLEAGVNVFAVDNCDHLPVFEFDESQTREPYGFVSNRSWTATDACGNTSGETTTEICDIAAVRVKALLNGALVGNNGSNLMRDNLRQLDLLPLEEPYSALVGFPHVEYQHEPVDTTPPPTEMTISVCHLPGTANQSLTAVPLSQLEAHLVHGDRVGSCSNSNEVVTICHAPGTPEQRAQTIPQTDLTWHLAHGDLLGACAGNAADPTPAAAASAQFKTIADGDWGNSATWQGGDVPPFILNNATVSIKHNVSAPNGTFLLKNNAKLWITNGSLKTNNGNFIIQEGALVLTNATFSGGGSNDFQLTTSSASLIATNSTLSIGQDFENNGGIRKLENSTLKVGSTYAISAGRDTLIGVCAVIQQGIENNGSGKMHLVGSKLKVLYGSFQSGISSTVSGSNLVILVENGSLTSTGLWSASVSQYCVSNTLALPPLAGPLTENCINIANVFSPCTCEDVPVPDSGGGNNSGADLGATNGINPGNSTGDGTMLPELLDVTGQEAIVDWMLVEVRSALDRKEILGYSTVALQRDGGIVTEDGDSVIVFPGLGEGEYYVAVRHRNHLGMMTDSTFYLSSNDVPLVDFTDTAMPVWGGSQAGKTLGGRRTLWSGDYNEDGKVVYQGPYNDVFHLFSRVLPDSNNTNNLANYIVPGYELHDFNLDGKIIYQGPNNDRASMLYHTVLSHPGNIMVLANYIVTEKLLP